MGRRSIGTTKSGKFMNPTDQIRKELRKKELKKNKKQRQLVRVATLKGKDPLQLIIEMQKIDHMEYGVFGPPTLNETVLQDKRKKLKDTFEKVLKLYSKEDPEKWSELKQLEVEYDGKRAQLVAYFDSVRQAQQVRIEEIPLPLSQPSTSNSTQSYESYDSSVVLNQREEDMIMQIPLPSDLPLPPPNLSPMASTQDTNVEALFETHSMPSPDLNLAVPVHGILKKTSAYSYVLPAEDIPPGVPVGPPPDLSDDEEEEEEDEVAEGQYSPASSMETNSSQMKEEVQPKVLRFADPVDDRSKTPDEKIEEEEEEDCEIDVVTVEDDVSSKDKPEDIYDEKVTPGLEQTPNKIQQEMIQISGQDIDEFMKEMEILHKREINRLAEINANIAYINQEAEENSNRNEQILEQIPSGLIPNTQPPLIPSQLHISPIQQVQMMQIQPFTQLVPLQQIISQPPPPTLTLITQPPPQLPQLSNQQQGVQQNIGSIPPGPPLAMPQPPLMIFGDPTGSVHLPPGPPPGIPSPSTSNLIGSVNLPLDSPPAILPNIIHPQTLFPTPPQVSPPLLLQLVGGSNPNVLSAAPQLVMPRGVRGIPRLQGYGATIQAKPQIKHVDQGVTRFIPSSLRARREPKNRRFGNPISAFHPPLLLPKPESTVVSGSGTEMPFSSTAKTQSKDDAYIQFMKEIESLL